MNSPSREEFEARMREAAAVADARALRTENKLDEMLHRMDARDTVYQMQFQHMNEKLETVIKDVHDVRTTAARDMRDMRASMASDKTIILTTVLATGIALASLFYTFNSSLFSAFESGKSTAAGLTEANNRNVSALRATPSNHRAPSESTDAALPNSTPAVRAE